MDAYVREIPTEPRFEERARGRR